MATFVIWSRPTMAVDTIIHNENGFHVLDTLLAASLNCKHPQSSISYLAISQTHHGRCSKAEHMFSESSNAAEVFLVTDPHDEIDVNLFAT